MKIIILLFSLAMLSLAPLRAQTPDSCVINSLPYVQDFDNCPNSTAGVLTPFVPGWQRLANSDDTPTTSILVETLPPSANTANTPAKVISIYPGNSPDWYRCLVMPQIDSALLATGTLQLRLRFIYTDNTATNLLIGTITNDPDTDIFTSLDTLTLHRPETPGTVTNYDAAYETTIPLTGRLTPNSRIALLLTQGSNRILLDRATIERTPSCGAMQCLRCIADGPSGVMLQWDGKSNTTDNRTYTVKLYPHVTAGTMPPNDSCLATFTANHPTFAINHLNNNTDYGIVVYDTRLIDSTTGHPTQWEYINFKTTVQRYSGMPPSIAISAIDSTNISIIWIANGNDSQWDVRLSIIDNTGTPSTPVQLATNYLDYSYTFTGLSLATEYYLMVSPSSNNVAYTRVKVATPCPEYATLPFFEDFERFNYQCWDWFYADNGTPMARSYLGSDNHFLFFNYTPEYVVLPPMPEPINNLILSGEIVQGAVVVGVQPYSDTTAFIPVDTVLGADESVYPAPVQSFTVFFSDYTGDDGRIVIHCTRTRPEGYVSLTSIDNLLVEASSSCHRPYRLSALATGTTSASIHWVDIDQSMNYEIEYGRHGFAHGEGITLGVFTDSITLNGLLHSTNYDVYVRSHCVGDTSEWSHPVTFTTMCGDIDTIPYIEDFSMWDASTLFAPTLPSCWTFMPRYPNTLAPYIEQYEDLNHQQGKRLYSNNTNTSVLALPRINRSRFQIQDLRLIMTAYSNTSTAFFDVGVCSDTMGYNSFTPVETIHLTETPTRYVVSFANYTGTGEYIAIRYNFGNRRVYINDFTIDYLPDCQCPFSVSASDIDTTHATLSWLDRSPATGWQIVCGPHGFTLGQDTAGVVCFNASSNPYTIGGLQSSRSYDIYIRSYCNLGIDTSEYIYTPCQIHTMQRPAHTPYFCDFENTDEALQWQNASNRHVGWHYGVVDTLPLSHGYFLDSNTANLLFPQRYHAFLYRDIDFGPASPSGYDSSLTLSVRFKKNSLVSYTMGALLANTTAPIATFTTNGVDSTSPFWLGHLRADTNWTTASFQLDTIHGIRRLLFYITGITEGREPVPPVSLDDVWIGVTPCPRPFNLHAERTSGTTSDLTWYGPDSARYLVTWKKMATATTPSITYTDTATTNHFILSNLMPDAHYQTKVQRICPNGSLTPPTSTLDIDMLLCNNQRSDTITIDTNTIVHTQLLPITLNDDYSYSQQIFRAEELAGPGTINSISLKYTLNFTSLSHFVYIYLGHTNATSFPNFNSYVNPSTLQLVYVGALPMGNGWNRIPLPSVFEYDGVSNLVMAVAIDRGTSKANYYYANNYTEPMSIVFHGQDEIDITAQGLSVYNGTINLTPSRNQAIFGFCPADYCPRVELKRPNVHYSRVTLHWHDDGNSNYEVYYYNTANATSETLTTSDSSITINNIYPDYKYIYRVRKICDDGSFTNWSYGTFRTSPDDCPFPENLRVSALTHNQAYFEWTPDENNTTYTLHIFNGAFDTTVNTIVAHATVSGLLPGITTYASVQAHCSPDNRTAEWSDTIRFTTPVCPASDSLTFSDLQGNSVVLDWQTDSQNGNPEVTQWEIQYGPIGFTQGSGISVFTDHHPYTLQHLIGETNYDAYVRSICSDDYYSEHWSNKINFTTLYSDITEPDTATFTLHPNPTKDHFTIHRLNSDAPFSVIIRDVHGRELVKKQFATLNLEFSTLDYPSGVYFVTIVTPQGTATRKLIIER